MTRPKRSTAAKRGGSSRNIADHLVEKDQETADIFKETANLDIQPRRRSLRIRKAKKVYFEESDPESLLIEDASILKEPTQNEQNPIIETCNTTVDHPMEEEFWAITPPRDEEPPEGNAHVSDGTETLPPTIPTVDYSQFSALETQFQLSAMPETAVIRETRPTAVPEESIPPTIPKADYDRYSIMEMPGPVQQNSRETGKTQDVTESLPPTVPQFAINSQFSALETPFQLSAMPETAAIRQMRLPAIPEESIPPTLPKADYDRYSIMEMTGQDQQKSAETGKTQDLTESLPPKVPPLDFSQFSSLETPYQLSAMPVILPKKSTNGNSVNESDHSVFLAQNLYQETPEVGSFLDGTQSNSAIENKKAGPFPKEDFKKQGATGEWVHFRVTGNQNYDDSSIYSSVFSTIHCNNQRRILLQQRFPW